MPDEPKIKALSERMRDGIGGYRFSSLGKWADEVAALEAENTRLNLLAETNTDAFIQMNERWNKQNSELEQQLAAERERWKDVNREYEAVLLDRNELLAHYQRATSERDQLHCEIASLRENARVCDCYGSRLTKYPKW